MISPELPVVTYLFGKIMAKFSMPISDLYLRELLHLAFYPVCCRRVRLPSGLQMAPLRRSSPFPINLTPGVTLSIGPIIEWLHIGGH
jgi:hypothetical protein